MMLMNEYKCESQVWLSIVLPIVLVTLCELDIFLLFFFFRWLQNKYNTLESESCCCYNESYCVNSL